MEAFFIVKRKEDGKLLETDRPLYMAMGINPIAQRFLNDKIYMCIAQGYF